MKTRLSPRHENPTAAADGADARQAFSRGWGFLLSLAMATGGLALTGCQTFNYTDEDLARERTKLAESWASGGWRS